MDSATPRLAKHRDYRQAPLFRMSAGLVDTYLKINKHYYACEAARKKRAATASSSTTASDSTIKRSRTTKGYDDENDDYIVRKDELWNERFQILRPLGKGSFGQVVEAYDREKDMRVAIKIIKNRKTFYNQAMVEVRILQHLNSKDMNDSNFIVRMKEHFCFRNHLCIVYERLYINLYEYLKRDRFKGISLCQVRSFSMQILSALKFLSRPEIAVIHCDLKPENILLKDSSKSSVKVIDFGSSCFATEKTYSYIQSRFYRSPEVILGYPYTAAIDMWSLGCILVEFISGEPLFSGQTEHDQMCRICDVLGMPPAYLLEACPQSKISKMFMRQNDSQYRLIPSKTFRPTQRTLASIIRTPKNEFASLSSSKSAKTYDGSPTPTFTEFSRFVDLVDKMLQYDPKKRITPDEALQHSFFRTVADGAVNTQLTRTPYVRSVTK